MNRANLLTEFIVGVLSILVGSVVMVIAIVGTPPITPVIVYLLGGVNLVLGGALLSNTVHPVFEELDLRVVR